MAGITIRLARAEERPALEALQRRAALVLDAYREALLAHPEAIEIPTEQFDAGRVAVAEIDGAVLGLAVVLPRADGEAELDGLFVEPGEWRRGIGSALVRRSAATAAAMGAAWLEVAANPYALDFYTACGFRIVGDCETQFGPAVVMRKAVEG